MGIKTKRSIWKKPQGYKKERNVCLLKKVLYGLKRAPLQWRKELTNFLKQKDMIEPKTDQCVFKSQGQEELYLGIQVGDGSVTGSDLFKINSLLIQ